MCDPIIGSSVGAVEHRASFRLPDSGGERLTLTADERRA